MPVLSRFQSVNASTTVNADFTPTIGQLVIIRALSTLAPGIATAQGYLIWDPNGANKIIDAWSFDKVVSYERFSKDFTFTGDGVKILRISLQNTESLTAVPIGGSVIYELG